ncbi:MAG: phenylalanine--tRNA ligase subunit alpha, partial [Oscillibacter sp.]|nr:phenylalanine--tRNA ligase subunit alpha [Oscillibacter sp.]
MKEQLEAIRLRAMEAIADAAGGQDLEALRVKYLGRKGELTAVLKQMGGLSAELRPVMGKLANDVRASVERAIEEQSAILERKAMEARLALETVDVTMPGKKFTPGHKHPMYTALDEFKEVFIDMGFEVMDGPEVEKADYNFTRLNTPDDHPAREWTDTFYLDEESKTLLRTQTSP